MSIRSSNSYTLDLKYEDSFKDQKYVVDPNFKPWDCSLSVLFLIVFQTFLHLCKVGAYILLNLTDLFLFHPIRGVETSASNFRWKLELSPRRCNTMFVTVWQKIIHFTLMDNKWKLSSVHFVILYFKCLSWRVWSDRCSQMILIFSILQLSWKRRSTSLNASCSLPTLSSWYRYLTKIVMMIHVFFFYLLLEVWAWFTNLLLCYACSAGCEMSGLF